MATWIGTGAADPGDDLKVGNHNVGIGAATPGAPLHLQKDVAGGTPWIGQVKIEPASDNSDSGISLMTTRTDTDRIWSIMAGSGAGNTNLRIYDSTAGADRLNIDSSGNVGIGSTTPPSKLHVEGSVGVKVVSKSAAYTAADETVILVDASGGAVTITLPPASTVTGRVYYIKRTSGIGGTVTIDGDSSETIDGAPTKVLINQYACLQIVSNGSAWYILAQV